MRQLEPSYIAAEFLQPNFECGPKAAKSFAGTFAEGHALPSIILAPTNPHNQKILGISYHHSRHLTVG